MEDIAMKKSKVKKNYSKLPAVKRVLQMANDGNATEEQQKEALLAATVDCELEAKRQPYPWEEDSSVDQKKAEEVIERIIDSFTLEKRHSITVNDARLQSLSEQYFQAEKKLQMLKASVIRRQMEAHVHGLLANEAAKYIRDLTKNGNIVCFLADEDKEKYNHQRAKIFFMLDVLDSAMLDFQSILRSAGLYGHFDATPEIEGCRKAISTWSEETMAFMMLPSVKPLIFEEADKLSEHVDKRIEVLGRKVERVQLKESKNQ